MKSEAFPSTRMWWMLGGSAFLLFFFTKISSKCQEKVWRFNISPLCHVLSTEGRELSRLSDMPTQMNASRLPYRYMQSRPALCPQAQGKPCTVMDSLGRGCVESRSNFLKLFAAVLLQLTNRAGIGAPCQAGAIGCMGWTFLG